MYWSKCVTFFRTMTSATCAFGAKIAFQVGELLVVCYFVHTEPINNLCYSYVFLLSEISRD